jgi:hypothetical protein
MQQREQEQRRRVRFTPLAIGLGVLSSAMLGLGATGTFSAFTASIQNTSDTAAAASLIMQETDGSGTTTNACKSTDNNTLNSSTCATFDKYGGTGTPLTPGGSNVTSVRIYDTGSMDPVAFTLTPAACTPSAGTSSTGGTGNICNTLTVTLTCTMSTAGATAITVYNAQTPSAIATAGAKDLRALGCLPTKNSGAYATMQFTVSLPTGADNTVQGQTASQRLTWQFLSS